MDKLLDIDWKWRNIGIHTVVLLDGHLLHHAIYQLPVLAVMGIINYSHQGGRGVFLHQWGTEQHALTW